MKTKYIIKDLHGTQVFGYSTYGSFREAWDYIHAGYGYSRAERRFYVVPEAQ